jgi:hypothetical protein
MQLITKWIEDSWHEFKSDQTLLQDLKEFVASSDIDMSGLEKTIYRKQQVRKNLYFLW